jgi:CBS domain-containing protein
VEEMIQRKIGSAVIVERGDEAGPGEAVGPAGRVMGVFTTVDALRALADLLEAE